MNAEFFSDALGQVSDQYIHEASEYGVKMRKKTGIRWIAIAACICLLMGAITVMAATGLGTSIIEFFTDKFAPGSDFSESGYTLAVQIEKIPDHMLRGSVVEVGDLIKQQYAHQNLYSSWWPGHWQKKFESRKDACEYIGFRNLRQQDWGMDEKSTTLFVSGNPDGKLEYLSLETFYEDGDIHLQFWSRIYTEHYKGEITIGSVTTESVSFTESFYTTISGKQCHVIASTQLDSGRLFMDGHLVIDGVLYTLSLSYPEKDTENAMALMEQWADSF